LPFLEYYNTFTEFAIDIYNCDSICTVYFCKDSTELKVLRVCDNMTATPQAVMISKLSSCSDQDGAILMPTVCEQTDSNM